MPKRMIFVFSMMVAVCTVLFFRIYYLTSGDFLSAAAVRQSSYRLDVINERGMIYDAAMKPLVNRGESYVAAIMPCPEALSAMSKAVTGERRQQMIESFGNNRPFLMNVDTPNIYSYGVDVFRSRERYCEPQTAVHIVGHLSDGKGALGIESAYDEILSSCGSKASISYTVDAKGTPLKSTPPLVTRDEQQGGVVLTLDRDIQEAVERIAPYYIKNGAVVVMDIKTGDIKASLSLPVFDQNDILSGLKDESKPFVNRAFSQYSVGSSFKILMAALALDSGISEDLAFECKGYIEVNGLRFGCQKLDGHGWLTMKRALEQSCNPYFINIGQRLDSDKLLSLCETAGLGRYTKLAPGMIATSGRLPSSESLENRAEMANFSFGQGVFTASPLQVASYVSLIANGGFAVTPRLVLGGTEDGKTISEENTTALPVRAVSEASAKRVSELMISVVENGSGHTARPLTGSAGGKTSSAQTGIFKEAGGEIVHAWFAGFYPANDPKYSIVVLNEDGNSGGTVAAPVFRETANAIAELKGIG